MQTCRLSIIRGTGSSRLLRAGSRRGYSSARLAVEQRHDSVATVTLASPPVNALDAAMVSELTATVQSLEADPTIRGLVLSSATPGLFSAGLHLPELLIADDGSTKAVEAFWRSFQV